MAHSRRGICFQIKKKNVHIVATYLVQNYKLQAVTNNQLNYNIKLILFYYFYYSFPR